MVPSNLRRVRLMAGSFGWDFILRGPHGQERVIQFDWDYPRYAADFGWSPSLVNPESGCPHENTDGTVACRKCGIAISDFLSHACDHLIPAHPAERCGHESWR